MTYSKLQLWERFKQCYASYPQVGLALDVSRIDFSDDFFKTMEPRIQDAFAEMDALEKGATANPDENRMVGHYWLRNPGLAPTAGIRNEIADTVTTIKEFAANVHIGKIAGAKGRFTDLLLIGIGGSALGPQFVAKALGSITDQLHPHFFDNTDPEGMDNVLSSIGTKLGNTLCIIVSKSGGTKETRNGMLEAKAAYERQGLKFGAHAVSITKSGSDLDKYALENKFIRSFPMWDWVGGRTSELSAVGLLPAALQGFEIDAMLEGAKKCDEITRFKTTGQNPAALLALSWFAAGNGKGDKSMVVLPYKDRLELFSRYLQQLVMESLGKELDRSGQKVNQGIAVFGNKGSTDQHAYVQQLRDGQNNFFATFIEVLKDVDGTSLSVDPQVTSGDYLSGFYQGTRRALYDKDRQSITITLNEVSPFSIGVLIALFERAVGLYASLININAYHQPGVEAGKKAAEDVLRIQNAIYKQFDGQLGKTATVVEIAGRIGSPDEVETVFKICQHLAANPDRGIRRVDGGSVFDARYQKA